MVTDIVERLFDAQITTSARARDEHDAEVYAVLIDAAEEIALLRAALTKIASQSTSTPSKMLIEYANAVLAQSHFHSTISEVKQ